MASQSTLSMTCFWAAASNISWSGRCVFFISLLVSQQSEPCVGGKAHPGPPADPQLHGLQYSLPQDRPDKIARGSPGHLGRREHRAHRVPAPAQAATVV